MKDYPTKAQTCPYCGYVTDGQLSPRDRRKEIERAPKAGDVSMCANCTGLLIFDGNLELQKPTEAQLLEVQSSRAWPGYLAAKRIVKTLQQKGITTQYSRRN